MCTERLATAAGVIAILLQSISGPVHAQAVRRSAFASALDRSGAPVPNLGPTDFVVREDKVAREILEVAPADDPMDIAVLIDNSSAGEPYISDYRRALPPFIKALGADPSGARHQVAIITIGDRPTINTNYSFDLELAIKGTQRIFAQPLSGSYLLEAIIETSKGIEKRGATRPVILAIATEGPELSDRAYVTVLESLRASGAALHVVLVGPQTTLSHDRDIVVDTGTRETGGRNDKILTSSALTDRLAQIAAELTHQYRVTYARPQTLIPPEQVTVSAARPGLTIRGVPAREVREQR